MRTRIPPSERTSERLRQLLNEGMAAEDGRSLKSAFVLRGGPPTHQSAPSRVR